MPERIYKQEFNELLHQISSLSEKERAHLNQVFASDLVDGLDPYELKQRIDGLKFHQDGFGTDAYLDQDELADLKQKLLSHMQ
jgi:hypothetical protein